MSNCNPEAKLKGKMPTEPTIVEGLCLEVACGVVLSCVTKTTTYTQVTKGSYTSETVYTDKDGAVIEGKEVDCPIKVEVVTQPVEPPAPIEPITLDGQDCDGAPLPATGMPGELVQIVQAPGQALTVRFCADDKDFEVSCGKDPATGHEVQTVYRIEAGAMVVYGRWDVVTGQPWTGDPTTLEACGGSRLESDERDVCVNGENLTQWIVKKDGVPTNAVYYTDANGQLVDVPASAVVVAGLCVPRCADAPIVDCDNVIHGYAYNVASAAAAGATVPIEGCDGSVFGYILPAIAPGHTKPITMGCGADAEIIGYAADIGCASDIEQESDPVDVCIDGVPATRWQIKENGVPVSVAHYTNAKGELIYPTVDAVITLGHCTAVCAPTISSAFADDLSALLPGTTISLQKPTCCALKVTTSAGEFMVAAQVAAYSTSQFNCAVTVDAVEVVKGSCNLADIIVTTQG